MPLDMRALIVVSQMVYGIDYVETRAITKIRFTGIIVVVVVASITMYSASILRVTTLELG